MKKVLLAAALWAGCSLAAQTKNKLKRKKI